MSSLVSVRKLKVLRRADSRGEARARILVGCGAGRVMLKAPEKLRLAIGVLNLADRHRQC